MVEVLEIPNLKHNDLLIHRQYAVMDVTSFRELTTIRSMQFTQVRRFWLLIGLCSIACGLWGELRAAESDELFWSFRPVRQVPPPAVRATDWVRTPIDQFILAALEKRGLSPAPPADRRTLLRRAVFDLTGLPPTPAEIDAFVADDSPDAFAKVVDRLLASPRYGERWGRHWLDVVRYADARDLIQLPAESDFREAWRYRDWVVKSFNRDLPYDQFVRQQVAGDLLQPPDPTRIDADALVATGMLAIADFVPGDVDKQQMIADYVNDQIDVVGRAFLGLTLACARCHDHKFDPISIDDYYSLAGIFFSTRLVPGPIKGNTPLTRAPLLSATEIAAVQADQARDKARLAELTREVNLLGEREYWNYIEQQVTNETQRYLLAGWEFVHSAAKPDRPAAEEFAKGRGLDAVILSRWSTYFEEQKQHPAFMALRGAPDKVAAELLARELAQQLLAAGKLRGELHARDATTKTLAETEVLRLQSHDRRIVTNETQHLTFWPNRGRRPGNASPVPEVATPTVATVMIGERTRPLIHFSGNELFQVQGTIPAIGSLVVVFRPDPAGASGQRLVGWEDASVGQHGLGIMTDAKGSVQAILRRNGANGDVTVPAPASAAEMPPFQILCITWGSSGVTVHRQGQVVGNNKTIDSVSSDPAITALKIGGPGSGASPRFQGDIAELRIYNQPLDDLARARVETELTQRWCSKTPIAETPNDIVTDLYEELISPQSPFRLEAAERDKVLPGDFQKRLTELRGELEAVQKKKPVDIPQAVVVQEGGPTGTPHEGFHDAHVYLRGNHLKPGKTVPRGFPKAIAGVAPPVIREGSGRRELAQWLTSPENPLTARVLVNRVWQHHFGVGLVSTSANLGENGERPSHPELLDDLAARFIASGWSIKALHRLIMLSNVYQQNSAPNAAGLAADPENRLLWRANRRRLDSESLRDSLLTAAGRLDSTQGGPGFQEIGNPRRTLYLMAVRTGAKTAEFGSLFDAADCTGIVERRFESTVAPQALFLMNDPFVSELATALAQRVTREVPGGSELERIRRLYEITLGRLPKESEITIGLQLLVDPAQSNAWASYCRVLLCTNEFMFVD
ncbi:MAG: Protein of unknown function (DUF1553)/Protein of unknown function (DUF1549)/Planctomycete [Planctomycetaceae bacterium]|nr:Protein of unknown function (DUF1553)/Protein of unknown function (DUF1549)/Planctomycete [Planctomycetaceae bacterium]